MAEELRNIEPIRSLLLHKPLAILSDIDGTLAPIVPNPDEACVSDRAHAALTGLIAAGAKVGLITGRALERARAMAGLDEAIFATSHGLNIWAGGEVEAPAELREWVERAQALIAELDDMEAAGVTVEDKGVLVAFHYRRAPSEAAALAAIRSAIAKPSSAGFRVQHGRKVIELRPPIDIDKGTAAVELVRRMGARAVLCMGDDATDVDMFRAVRTMRSDGIPTTIVAVDSPEVTDDVLAASDYYVRDVTGVEWLLEETLKALTGPTPTNP
ncbi:MAG: trehalose-phosphatase [Dehalococcoidia bacterium]